MVLTPELNLQSGNVCIRSDEGWLLVDNLAKGFDLYQYPHTSPSESFLVPRKEAYVHNAIFLENRALIGCGSDHGRIYIFCPETADCKQQVKHGSKRSKIQVLAVSSLPSNQPKESHCFFSIAQLLENIYLQVVQMIQNLKSAYGKRFETHPHCCSPCTDQNYIREQKARITKGKSSHTI